MTWNFGDSFDLYAVPSDAINGYWDSGNNLTVPSLVAGRFSGSRALRIGPGWGASDVLPALLKSSGVNDPVHHIVLSLQQFNPLSGTTHYTWLTLFDGATAQCSIYFRLDGGIYLTSGAPNSGTVLASFPGALTALNTWYAFELEVVINSTTGSFAIRKNGNNVNDFTATGLNTQVSANAYANKISLGCAVNNGGQDIDDLFWQSGAATGNWLGDIRCYTRMPVSDQSVAFSGAGARTFSLPGAANQSTAANRTFFGLYTFSYAGTFSSIVVNAGSTAYTGNIKCALFNDNGSGAPGTVLVSATNVVTNTTANSTFTFTFSPAVSVTIGQKVWFSICTDSAGSAVFVGSGTAGWTGTTTYASFPAANPSGLAAAAPLQSTITIAPLNSNLVNEPQEDGLATYVYDSNPGDADFYNIASITSTPTTIIATTVRSYAQKSDAGTRTLATQIKSGATTVASPTLILTTSGWQWGWRTDIVDPNTSAAWTAAAVNAVQIGPKVVA